MNNPIQNYIKQQKKRLDETCVGMPDGVKAEMFSLHTETITTVLKMVREMIEEKRQTGGALIGEEDYQDAYNEALTDILQSLPDIT